MPTKDMSVDSALRKILAARARGVLPADLRIATDRYSIDLDLPRGHQNGLRVPELADWVQKNFPGGQLTDRRLTVWGTRSYRRNHDQAVYRARLDGIDLPPGAWRSGTVIISAPVILMHEHIQFRAHTGEQDSRTGMPKWFCTSCNRSITLTEARRRGLIPEKASSK